MSTPAAFLARPTRMAVATRARHHEAASAWTDLLQSVGPREGRRLGLSTHRIQGRSVLVAAGVDSLLFNRAFLEGTQDLRPERLEAVLRIFHREGVRRFMLHVPMDLAGVELETTAGEALATRGLELYRRDWHVLESRFEPRARPRPSSNLTPQVERARPADAEACGALLASAFEMPPEAARVWAAAIDGRRWHSYLIRHEGRIVATGCLYVQRHVGYLAAGATDPAFRGRGAQSALIARRLAIGGALGCVAFASDTGEAVPGEANPSHRNLCRAGLIPTARVRHVVPLGTTWTA